MKRETTKKIMVGNVPIGGGSPITVQSMTNTNTKDIVSTVKQIKSLEDVDCDIVRSAITDIEDAKAIGKIKRNTSIPFIADIQNDYKLAIAAVKNGADCLRINPGNIGSEIKVREVINICKERQIPIRVGVNAGSLNKKYLDKYEGVNADSMVYSALEHIRLIEKMNYDNIKVSLKASNVPLSIETHKKATEMIDYPLHLGITEAGPIWRGTIKSSVGIGILLAMGVGDTIRISLTGDPVEEIKVGREILKSLNLLEEGIEIISCPTCARTEIDLVNLVEEAERRLEDLEGPLKVAIMGCPVNGPGEAREADIGIAGGQGEGLIFKKGKIIKKVDEENLIDALIEEIEKM